MAGSALRNKVTSVFGRLSPSLQGEAAREVALRALDLDPGDGDALELLATTLGVHDERGELCDRYVAYLSSGPQEPAQLPVIDRVFELCLELKRYADALRVVSLLRPASEGRCTAGL